jgi:hypothetical protein
MNFLNITLGEHQAKIESPHSSIKALRSSLKQPIEVEAFGAHIFLSIMGTKQDVSLTLIDKNNTLIDTESYQLGSK